MTGQFPFASWHEVLQAPRSAFFRGRTSDSVLERSPATSLAPHDEALFAQSNARVLVGQAANGTFRLIMLPTQVYPVPLAVKDIPSYPGNTYRTDTATYAGNLAYSIQLDGAEPAVDLAAETMAGETTYAADFLPLTRMRAGNLEASLITLAPVADEAETAALAPAPLPGPAGALYVLRMVNAGTTALQGRVTLRASDLLLGGYEDASAKMRPLKRPAVDLRRRTLILTRPEGAVGIHLHDGNWTRLEAPFEAERAFSLGPGEDAVIETYLAMGSSYQEVLPVIFGLHTHSALDWLNLTAAFWRDRLGRLQVGASDASREAQASRDIYIRCLLDNFNCLQTDANGDLLAHWQGAPPGDPGLVMGIDVEPTAVSVAQVCPELARQVLLFFMTRSRPTRGAPDHSVPILVAPLIIARKWLEATDDLAFLQRHPEVMAALRSIVDDLMALKAPSQMLFPSRYSSDGPVGRRYDYGTNVKVWYALDCFAYLLKHTGQPEEAERYHHIADEVQGAIEGTMVAEGPFGPQISGGTNLGEGTHRFYLPEHVRYYDGEDTSSMLAPVYGLCDFTHEPWVNYHRFARSLWCPNYDPEFDTLRWAPSYGGIVDGTGYLSRLGGSITPTEMREAHEALHERAADDVSGSVYWWPSGHERKRVAGRCNQGQGAWAWQYQQQWLGLSLDAPSRTLTLAPRGMLTAVDWPGWQLGPWCFDIHWVEDPDGMVARIRNRNDRPWRLQAGFRQPGAGAEGPLVWQAVMVEPGGEAVLSRRAAGLHNAGLDRATMLRAEAAAFAGADGILLRRFGPATLWGLPGAAIEGETGDVPLAVRLVVMNGSSVDWASASLELTCPDGWLAQSRPCGHWLLPDHLTAGAASVDLGPLPAMSRTVAAFWVKGPHSYDLFQALPPEDDTFHADSQPANELTLPTADVSSPQETELQAVLLVTAADGDQVRKQLRIPVHVVPCRRNDYNTGFLYAWLGGGQAPLAHRAER